MSQQLDRLVADNLDIWTSATIHKSGAGRGGGKRVSLYGIERLRALILDLAVQGKLVPQDAGEEPAKRTFAEIERQRRLTGLSNREPEKKIENSELPFSIPQSWEWVRLGSFDPPDMRGGNHSRRK